MAAGLLISGYGLACFAFGVFTGSMLVDRRHAARQ